MQRPLMSLAPASLLSANDAESVPPAIDPTDALAVAKAQAALGSRQRAVLRELTLLADRNGQVQVTQAELVKATRLSLRTIRLACKELDDLGWITRQAQSQGKAGRLPDLYTIQPAPLPTSARAA